jgi:ferric-dicitrate binding protein FerR (iron transport regulator)
MKSDIDEDTRVAEQATMWLGRLLERDGDTAAFFSWLEESPRHVEEFLRVSEDAKAIASLTSEQLARLDAVSSELSWDDVMGENVVPISHEALESYERSVARPPQGTSPSTGEDRAASAAGKSVRALKPRWLLTIAASIFAVCVTAFVLGPGSWKTYTTKIGEQQKIELPDGSVVILNTDSQVAVRLTNTARIVALERGQALFSVEHDSKRPFQVRSGGAVIQAIGTQFDVYRQTAGTRVAVIEGLVQISAGGKPVPPFPASPRPSAVTSPEAAAIRAQTNGRQLLAAGEEAYVVASGEISQRKRINTLSETAWRQRRLVFEAQSLAIIASEFNRYNSRVKVRALGDAGALRFSGTFNADAPQDLVKMLVDDPRLRVELRDNEVVIEPRGGDDL